MSSFLDVGLWHAVGHRAHVDRNGPTLGPLLEAVTWLGGQA
jgi:hypothetical protein